MRKIAAILTLACVLTLAVVAAACAAPTISITGNNASSYPNGQIPRYEKFEVNFTVGGVGTASSDYNPYNPSLNQPNGSYWNKKGILVDAIITRPNGTIVSWPCFWYEASDGSKYWKLRFAPTETGAWSYKIQVKFGSDTVQSGSNSFNCISGSNKGFIHVSSSDTRFFQHADGTVFNPIGTGTEGVDPSSWVPKHQTIFPKLAANGCNYARLFSARSDNAIEHYMSASVNKYHQEHCRNNDKVFDLARDNGIYVTLMLDDWTWFKGGDNPYIRSDGPCSNVTDLFNGKTRDGLNNAKEIYKRKIRYVMARWGYSANLFAVEMMNECYGASAAANPWHSEMGKYVQTFTAQPHLATTSLGSSRLRSSGTDWTSSGMDFVNYHDYLRISNTWTRIEIDATSTKMEQLGSSLSYPWYDMAVYMDRIARLHYKRQNRNKPIIFEEYGLIKVDSTTSDSGWGDWSSAYQADTTGRHLKDGVWAGQFALFPLLHWKSAYLMGTWNTSGEKYWIYKALSNFVKDEDFRGLKQETSYSVSDPINSSPTLTSSNGKIQAMVLKGTNRAYLYAKNLTDCWYRCVSSGSVPSPASQSGTVKIMGLEPGTYTLERWNTWEPDRARQILQTSSCTVGSDGVASISVSLGTGTTYDYAYKLKKSGGSDNNPPDGGTVNQPNVSLTMAADITTAEPGSTVTYTVTYKNSGLGAASNVVITVPVPANTTYVSGSGGALSSGQIKWTVPSVAAGATGTVSCKVTVN